MMSTQTQPDVLDDDALRKAWLKQTFGSHAYHESLLALHQQFKGMIRRALDRPEAKRDHRDSYDYFVRVAMPVIESIAVPGQSGPESWKPGVSRGFIGNISDYSRYIAEEPYWEWMPAPEQVELGRIWGQMNQMCTNIRQTVDKLWFNPRKGDDDSILNERYTGPIAWPENWRDQVLGKQAAALAGNEAIRIKAGEPVPKSGTYVALDPRERRFTVDAGDCLPDLNSSYGITVWQRIAD